MGVIRPKALCLWLEDIYKQCDFNRKCFYFTHKLHKISWVSRVRAESIVDVWVAWSLLVLEDGLTGVFTRI